MSFTNSSLLPFSVGGVLVAFAILAGASGWLSNQLAGCVVMPGILLVFDASVGTRVLSFYFFIKHPFTQGRVAELYFAKQTAFPRYAAAIVFSAIFSITVYLLNSDVGTGAAIVICVVAYGVLAVVSLVRSVSQARRETQQPIPG